MKPIEKALLREAPPGHGESLTLRTEEGVLIGFLKGGKEMDLEIGKEYDIAFKKEAGLNNGTYTLKAIDFGNWMTGGFYCSLTLSDGMFEVGPFTGSIEFLVPHRKEGKK